MQILIQVLCTKGSSIRQAIADDPRIERFALQVTKEAQPGAHRWLKLHATDETAARSTSSGTHSRRCSARASSRAARGVRARSSATS
jgi:hypothetical protein